MDVFAHAATRIRAALSDLESTGDLPAGLAFADLDVEAPRDPAHGDLASNAALVLAKAAKMKPRDIAEKLKAKLETESGIARVEMAGPGFLNITLDAKVWQSVVKTILEERARYGASNVGNGEPVNVEYVSINPTGPMHVGHGRGAVFGDALANLLAFAGFAVTREYYVNDAGGQVDALARSAYLRYREALGEEIGEIPPGLYPGDYLKPVGAALVETHGKKLLRRKEATWLPIVRETAVLAMLATIKEDLALLDIRHDVFFSEKSLTTEGHDEVKAAIDVLAAKGLVFEGRLAPPKGRENDSWEDREQTLFRSTAFGDDVDRPLQKSDGSYTYFAPDIAYHNNKLERGFKHLINVLGADHAGYISRMKAAVAALSDGAVDLDVKIVQLVRLLRAGEPVKMGKRAGTFVTLREVVEEVGSDPVRFMMLMRKNDAPLDFDLAKVVEQSIDNPVFYVQMGHARAASVSRKATEVSADLHAESPAIRDADLSLLSDPGELAVMKQLAAFPRVVEGAAKSHEPHRLAFYLIDLVAAFHAQWTRGNEMPHLRFIRADNKELTASRLALVAAAKQVISSGLGVLGVHAPDALR